MPINPLCYWSIKKLQRDNLLHAYNEPINIYSEASIIWYGLPTLNSDMPCFWKAHFALAWTSLLGIFFPDALHLVLHFHRSASRLGMVQLRSFRLMIHSMLWKFEVFHCRFLVPGNTQKILTKIWHHFWLKMIEIPRWPSEIPANLPGQFSLSGQIFFHWAAATLKAI